MPRTGPAFAPWPSGALRRGGPVRRITAHAAAGLLLACLASPAAAHDRKTIGTVHLTVGWGDEPALSGFKNSVEVDLADASGLPLTDPGATLAVEVSFGDQRITLPLSTAAGHPGRVRATLIPTRAGAYTFHVTGIVKGQPIDVTSACSDKTFACVTDASDMHFPEKDPAIAQLADRVSRTLPRTEAAAAAAATARTTALAALGVAVLALAAAIGAGMRKGRKGD